MNQSSQEFKFFNISMRIVLYLTYSITKEPIDLKAWIMQALPYLLLPLRFLLVDASS